MNEVARTQPLACSAPLLGSPSHVPRSPTIHPRPPTGDFSDLAAALVPALREACEGRLSGVSWFRAAWQAGGAATGTATFRLDDGREAEAVVKLPVGPVEFRWTCGLSSAGAGAPTPRVYASGVELGGHDLAWVVIERLPGTPLASTLNRASVEHLLRAAAAWYAHAERLSPVSQAAPPAADPHQDWPDLLHKAREAVRAHALPEAQRWNEAIKHAQKLLPRLSSRWSARAVNTWCHGDLHPGNAMWRTPASGDAPQCVLIDLALVHPGHWVEDAVYLERLYWGRPELLDGVKPVSYLARCRRELGLDTSDDYAGLANIRRALMAASAPVYAAHEGHPKYLHAAVETLERLLPQLAR